MQGLTVLDITGAFANVVLANPRLQGVATRRQVLHPITTSGVAFFEIWGFQYQNGSAHPVVNFAMNGDGAGLIENYRGRLFVLSIPAEIKPLQLRVRENVVIGVIEVRKVN